MLKTRYIGYLPSRHTFETYAVDREEARRNVANQAIRAGLRGVTPSQVVAKIYPDEIVPDWGKPKPETKKSILSTVARFLGL